MATQQKSFPPVPNLDRPESYYSSLAHEAEQAGDAFAHEAAKVGQYITLALNPALSWEEKLKYFGHALRRHCQPPGFPDDEVVAFFHHLADLVRQQTGQEALRIASTEDDLYAARLSLGQPRRDIEDEAEDFFRKIMGAGNDCPEWFTPSDWAQLKMIRDQWI